MRAIPVLKRMLLLVLEAIVGLLVLFPVLWVISTSLKAQNEVFTFPPQLIPGVFHWENYAQAWALLPFGQEFLNSFMISAPCAVFSVLLCSMAAYAFTRIRFAGRGLVFAIYLSTLMVPQVVRLIPSYIVLKNVGLLNSYAGVIIPQIAWMLPFGCFLIQQFLKPIPIALDEAARIDGAGHVRIFLQIIMPNAVPAMLTLGTYVFLSAWNNLIWTMVVVTKERFRTVTLGLATMTGPSVDFVPPWNYVMGATLIAIVPILILYIFFQKYFIQSVALSGVKG
jgi:ABC-type glycerol-3-phosphate transport system permease component